MLVIHYGLVLQNVFENFLKDLTRPQCSVEDHKVDSLQLARVCVKQDLNCLLIQHQAKKRIHQISFLPQGQEKIINSAVPNVATHAPMWKLLFVCMILSIFKLVTCYIIFSSSFHPFCEMWKMSSFFCGSFRCWSKESC